MAERLYEPRRLAAGRELRGAELTTPAPAAHAARRQ